ncbi:MAG: hypothetical protein VXU42_06600, partial [Verrucomicrobiota bacterium]|nr:hypothetical protein [Verrucomicrobiota bacterium]
MRASSHTSSNNGKDSPLTPIPSRRLRRFTLRIRALQLFALLLDLLGGIVPGAPDLVPRRFCCCEALRFLGFGGIRGRDELLIEGQPRAPPCDISWG